MKEFTEKSECSVLRVRVQPMALVHKPFLKAPCVGAVQGQSPR